MIRVKRIAYASFETPDIERQVAYYTDILGLTLVTRDKDAAYLSCGQGEPAVILRRGSRPACTRLAFQVAPETELGELARQVTGHGISVRRQSDAAPSIFDVVAFEDPKGTIIEVFREQSLRSWKPAAAGITPHKLGHVAFNCVDVKKITDFYCDVLGFRVSDWFADFFSFLRCGPDHHTINLLDSKAVRLNHMAFEVRDWSHLETACDFLSRHDIPLIWGPGRHGPGHNLFAYHKNPDGQIVELFAELDRMHDEELGYFEPRPWHRDHPQKPKVWPADIKYANLWGIPPPKEMME
jgi:catechol 2,3-dioxygenase-like lactoylglutathione lyase family enzyme